MKKLYILSAALILAAICLCACGNATDDKALTGEGLSIVTTIFPEYDWVMNVLGDNAPRYRCGSPQLPAYCC